MILALPPRSLEYVDWEPFKKDQGVRKYLHSFGPAPAVKFFLAFDKPWWRHLASTRRILTDLPSRTTLEMEVRPDDSSLLLASYTDGTKVQYWEGLMADTVAKVNQGSQYNVSQAMIDHVLMNIAEAFGISVKDIPPPTGAMVQFWNSDEIGHAWYTIKAGFDWKDVRDRMSKPRTDYEVYSASTYGFDEDPWWVDGSLKVAEYTLQKHFNLKPYITSLL